MLFPLLCFFLDQYIGSPGLCFSNLMILQDGDNGDDDQDEDGPREADTEGRVEKYIGVKVKASIL